MESVQLFVALHCRSKYILQNDPTWILTQYSMLLPLRWSFHMQIKSLEYFSYYRLSSSLLLSRICVDIQQLNKTFEGFFGKITNEKRVWEKFKIQHDMISVKSYLLTDSNGKITAKIQHHRMQTYIRSCRRCFIMQKVSLSISLLFFIHNITFIIMSYRMYGEWTSGCLIMWETLHLTSTHSFSHRAISNSLIF